MTVLEDGHTAVRFALHANIVAADGAGVCDGDTSCFVMNKCGRAFEDDDPISGGI